MCDMTWVLFIFAFIFLCKISAFYIQMYIIVQMCSMYHSNID